MKKYGMTADLIIEIAPCKKCGAKRGLRCCDGIRGASHKERLHLAQEMVHAANVCNDDLQRIPICERQPRAERCRTIISKI